MTYTEKELDQFLHGISLSLLSKKSAQHWRYDEETAKEIEWLEALERKVRADKADRKTEPQRDCFLCKWLGEVNVCGRCRNRNLFAKADTEPKPKTEPTISKMEQVDKDINVRSKDEPKTQMKTQNSNLTFEKADEPQTEEHCETCKHKDKCEGATYEYKNTEWWCLAYAPIEDEPQTDCAWMKGE